MESVMESHNDVIDVATVHTPTTLVTPAVSIKTTPTQAIITDMHDGYPSTSKNWFSIYMLHKLIYSD